MITSYVTMLTGPGNVPKADGSSSYKEMHMVILDNGRTRMQEDPVFREALQCIRCASCLNVCPVYQLIGGHVFGHVYTGIIGTVLSAFTGGERQSHILQELCLGCGKCREVCPGRIDLPKLNNALRSRAVSQQGLPAAQKFLMWQVLPNRKLFHSLLRMASVAQKPLVGREGTIRHLPFFLAGVAKGRRLPAIAEVPLRNLLTRGASPGSVGETRGRVGIFAGCLVDFVYPEIGVSMRKAVELFGFTPVFPMEQSCCGYPARQLGVPEVAAKLARKNLSAFAGENLDYIITPCPTCTYALKSIYPEIADPGPERKLAEETAAKVLDCSEFLYRQVTEQGRLFDNAPLKVTYHDSCHLKRSLHISREPRELLVLAGAELVEMNGADNCCGFGGSYSLKYPELSAHILEKKINSIRDTRAQTVVTGCPGCLMQLQGGFSVGDGENIKVLHIARLIAGDC
jgi:Fe-S oxidoreductase